MMSTRLPISVNTFYFACQQDHGKGLGTRGHACIFFCIFLGAVEDCQWTGWRDRDNPSGRCDCENILAPEVCNVQEYKIQLKSGGKVYTDYTGYSFSESLILASTSPKYDIRFFLDSMC